MEVGGIGYEIFVPIRVSANLDVSNETSLHIVMLYRNDTFQLFGFNTLTEKELFKSFLSVSNVGPKTALAILSHYDLGELGEIIYTGDVERLSLVPGIGKKTSQRLILELKYKISQLEEKDVLSPGSGKETSLEYLTETALVNLGYTAREAKKAVEELPVKDIKSLEEALKFCLKKISERR